MSSDETGAKLIDEPCLHTELNRPCDDGGNNLTPEHRSRRDFHVASRMSAKRDDGRVERRTVQV